MFGGCIRIYIRIPWIDIPAMNYAFFTVKPSLLSDFSLVGPLLLHVTTLVALVFHKPQSSQSIKPYSLEIGD